MDRGEILSKPSSWELCLKGNNERVEKVGH